MRVTNVLLTNSLLERNTVVDRLVASGSVNVDLMDMVGRKQDNHTLDYKLNLSYSKTFAKDFTFVPAFIQSTTNYLSKSNETLSQGYRNYSDALVENLLTYDGRVGRNHVNVVVGQTFQRELYHTLTGKGVNLPEPYYLQVNNAETSSNSGESEHVLASHIGRLNTTSTEIPSRPRYVGIAASHPTTAGDGSSVSAGGASTGRVHNVDPATINPLKVRGSYGELGNGILVNTNTWDVAGNYTYSFE